MALNTVDVISKFLTDHDLEHDRPSEHTFLVTLPGQTKLATHCALVVGDHTLSINAFVIRKPDENAGDVHAWCMAKNAAMYGIAFATNELGDIYLVGRLPLGAVNEVELDRLQLPKASARQDAIRREWAWRVSRGESLANLDAFKHLI